ncbi:MAG TPA: hypothetical protein VNF29_04215 [Candidatus Binataceae bacterium]|nr:hypothetical protein [Candidatus Binataceae bacterium]
MRKFKSLIVAVAGVAIVAAAAYAQPFGDHGGGSGWHYHGTSALAVCLAAAPEAVKTGLRTTFESSSIDADMQAVIAAKQALSRQILAKTADLTSYETALSNAERKLQQDKDAIAANICGQLSTKQLAAASTLYTNLQNDRATVIGYFAAAHAAAE